MEKQLKSIGILVSLVVLGSGLSCGTARRGELFIRPASGVSATATTEGFASGEITYMRFCQSCHPNGEAGLGPALYNKPIPGFLIRFQVRHGLGAMPAFKKETLPEEELSQLVTYIKTMRKAEPAKELTSGFKVRN